MKKYEGKNAFWFICLVILYNVLPLFTIFQLENVILRIVLIVLWYLLDLVFIPITFKNYVELYDNYFIFYYGFSKCRIDLKDIKKIEKSHNVIASSANSLDRIHIETKNNELYISLKQNDMFIKEVSQRII